MKVLRYVLALPGPFVDSALLSRAYDFYDGACEVTDGDAIVLLRRCKSSFALSEALSIQKVRNIIDSTAPVLLSAEAQGVAIILAYTEVNALDRGSIPAITDLVVTINAAPATIVSISVIAKKAYILLDTPTVRGDVITVSYTPGTVKLQDLNGNTCEALVSHAVVNFNLAIAGLSSASTSGGITLAPTGGSFALNTLNCAITLETKALDLASEHFLIDPMSSLSTSDTINLSQ